MSKEWYLEEFLGPVHHFCEGQESLVVKIMKAGIAVDVTEKMKALEAKIKAFRESPEYTIHDQEIDLSHVLGKEKP
jgi:hypothetical protein